MTTPTQLPALPAAWRALAARLAQNHARQLGATDLTDLLIRCAAELEAALREQANDWRSSNVAHESAKQTILWCADDLTPKELP